MPELVRKLDGLDISTLGETPLDKTARLQRLINTSPVPVYVDHQIMLFMKGTPAEPKCGFSRQAVELLNSIQIPFSTFNILSDETVRQGLKEYSQWPTFPQLYAGGELVGGLDIMKEMHATAELAKVLNATIAATGKSPLDARLFALINRAPIMLFMKGLPDNPQCGFSRQIVEILQQHGASFDAFNILEDEEVRSGLKAYSDWPTYPQLYIRGELIGGLDIIKQLHQSGQLEAALQSKDSYNSSVKVGDV